METPGGPTFDELIARNKRSSWILVLGLIGLSMLLGAAIGVSIARRDPELLHVALVGATLGGGLSSVFALISLAFGPSIIGALSGTHSIDRSEDPVLFNVVEEMAIAAGLPVPKIAVIYDESPNAFATGTSPENGIIGITSGLRKKLTRDELQAVIAHEMAHIKNLDIRLMMLVAVFAGAIVLVSDAYLRTMRFNVQSGNRENRGGSDKKGNPLQVILFIVAILFVWLSPILARILQLAVSREREYLADATAVQLNRNPVALIDALKKIASDPDVLEKDNRATEHLFIVNPDPKRRFTASDDDSIWNTHPPLIKRISRLRALVS